MSLVTSRTHGVTISEVKSDDEVAAAVEVGTLQVLVLVAGDATSVAGADDARGEDVELMDEPLARADLKGSATHEGAAVKRHGALVTSLST